MYPISQERVPVYEALLKYQQCKIAPLHTPGHKGVLIADGLEKFLTPLGLACDLPSMETTDNWFHPQGCIAEAQSLAAELYGASESFYLVNGSTMGVQTMILAAVAPGEKLLLPRYCHISAFSALVLSGAIPVYLPSRWSKTAGPVPLTMAELEQSLQRHPDTKAVFLTNPTYYGVGRNLSGFADLCHQHSIPLLVDEAHGAHLRFLPPGNLPSAIITGADIVVQSVHKTLTSLVGTAQLHRGHGSVIPKERIQSMLNVLQSSSSNYLLLASLDLTRHLMWKRGNELFQNAVEQANQLQERLNIIQGIKTLKIKDCPELANCEIDPLRLVVDVSGLKLSGFQLERQIQKEFHILGEFADTGNVIYVLGPPDTTETYAKLERAFLNFAQNCIPQAGIAKEKDNIHISPIPPIVLSPREAAFRPKLAVPTHTAIDRICGEVITVYPPGIPLICPGEKFTAEILNFLEKLAFESIYVFANDVSLSTVLIIAD
jgi:arginine/lysine/ornithine decarboxylase